MRTRGAPYSILVGHALNRLRSLAAESVHCVVTSPPYYGLRDYGCTPVVMGGDPECLHEWGCPQAGLRGRRGDLSTLSAVEALERPAGVYCNRCGAWQGELGSESVLDCLGWATGDPCGTCYICNQVAVFREVRRVLHQSGTLWLNIGDSYAANGGERDNRALGRAPQPRRPGLAGPKPKDLMMQPARLALALQADGWWLRSSIVWAKGLSYCPTWSGSVMPDSTADRPTGAYEHIFLLTKSARYYYDAEAVKEQGVYPEGSRAAKGSSARRDAAGVNARPPEYAEYSVKRNLRNVWAIPVQPSRVEHYATYPEALVAPCILAGTSEKGVCPQCASPWGRVVEKDPMIVRAPPTRVERVERAEGRTAINGTMVEPPRSRTVGWQPTCRCAVKGVAPLDDGDVDEEWMEVWQPEFLPVPATVLDPYAGSMTTLVVATKLGRRSIGIELNPDTAAAGEQRLRALPPLLPLEMA